jgi:hypothetical protein
VPTTIVLAGRRIDAPGTNPPRFPLAAVPLVRDRLRTLLLARDAGALVCSAACGADLVALEAAEALGLRRRIVLPFDPARFLATSVVDRPSDRPDGWGPVYDRLVEAARRAGDLVVLEGAGEGGSAYAAANERILDEALGLASAAGGAVPVAAGMPLAVVVWEGRPRDAGDTTAGFAAAARRRGLSVEEVLTV